MLYLDSENDLVLNPTALRVRKNQRLSELKKYFRTYYGFITTGDIATALALRQAIGEADQAPQPPNSNTTRGGRTATNANDVRAAREDLRVRADRDLVPIFEILMDGDNSSTKPILPTSGSVMDELNSRATSGNNDIRARNINNIKRCVKIHFCSDVSEGADGTALLSNASQPHNVYFKDLENAVPVLEDERQAPDFKRRIAVLRMQHPLLMAGEKNAELLSVFFNGIPTLELTRATPVLNIKFFSTRQTIQDNKLSAITLQKFVEGARDIGAPNNVANVPLNAFARSNQIATGSVIGNRQSAVNFETYTVTGLELFRMPQSMQNIEGMKETTADGEPTNHLAPIIDPFRPLASIKSFSIDVKSAYGLQGTRTATLEIVLHDRSRMAEFADFVKPDRFGETFLEVEYGWLHPDTEENVNPYAELLNLTRSVEHFTIVTSNFNFDEVGQVNITLNLIGRGAGESTELSIVGPAASSRIQQQIREIEQLSATINRLGGLAFPNQTENSENPNSRHRREIRGLQGLSAAGDATNNLILSREVIRELARLRTTLSDRSNNPRVGSASRQLQNAIDRLVGPNIRENANEPGADSSLAGITRSLNTEIRTILNSLNNFPVAADKTRKEKYYNDTFLKEMPVTAWNGIKNRIQNHDTPREGRDATPSAQLPSTGNLRSAANRAVPNISDGVFSLGTLITAFVAKPLAALKTGDNPKFKEVQVYFYNFNNKASWMSHCNISQFPVQTKYFVREYGRMRMESVSRTVNMSVNDFLNFIATKIVDDVMNPAYGLDQVYRYNGEGEVVQRSERTFDHDMRDKMQSANIGHHPDFVPPQVTFEMEALPVAGSSNNETILKIHIFDKACSPNNPYRELLTLATDNVLGVLSAYPGDPTQRQANEDLARQNQQDIHELQQNWGNLHRAVVQEVTNLGLINPVDNRTVTPAGSQQYTEYRFSGGPQKLKEYIMKGMPHIIYGAMGTTIKTATLGSQSDPALNTINIQRSLNSSPVQPNGQQPGGVPLSVYPVELNMTSLGCPILRYGQEIFVDYNTNTSIDNMYYITGLQHKIEAGSFETTIKFTAVDAFGRYRNLISQLNTASQTIANMTTSTTQNPATPQAPRHRSRPRRPAAAGAAAPAAAPAPPRQR